MRAIEPPKSGRVLGRKGILASPQTTLSKAGECCWPGGSSSKLVPWQPAAPEQEAHRGRAQPKESEAHQQVRVLVERLEGFGDERHAETERLARKSCGEQNRTLGEAFSTFLG